MKRGLALIAVLALGVSSAVALGAGAGQRALATTTAITTTGETGDTGSPGAKVWVCHHTGSWKHPNHLIHISEHALHAHLRNGDVAANSCPTSGAAERTHGHGRGHGAHPHGRGHDKNDAAEPTTTG